ncbi:putative uncharacterized protein C8orf44 [Plecturocebus cupreus]
MGRKAWVTEQDPVSKIKTARAQWLTPVIPALWEAEMGRSQSQELKTSLTNMAWWLTPLTSVLWEAEAGRSQGQEIKTILPNMLLGRLKHENHSNPGGGGREMGFRHVGHAGFELLTSGDPPTLASQSAGITDQAQWLSLAIPALWEGEVGRSHEARNLRPVWAIRQNPVSTKNTKISQVCCTPVIPATREAESRESLEPGRITARKVDISDIYQLFFFQLEMESHYVAQAGLKLLGSSYLSVSASQSANITEPGKPQKSMPNNTGRPSVSLGFPQWEPPSPTSAEPQRARRDTWTQGQLIGLGQLPLLDRSTALA